MIAFFDRLWNRIVNPSKVVKFKFDGKRGFKYRCNYFNGAHLTYLGNNVFKIVDK